jgi:hypothetical protein
VKLRLTVPRSGAAAADGIALAARASSASTAVGARLTERS